jgi:methionine-rich copper-binding protein CopC
MARRRSALRPLITAFGVLLGLAAGGQALAHAKLVSATPAEGETAAPPSELKLKFSEPIEIKLAQVRVTGSNSQAVKTGALALDPGDKTILIVPLAAPLADGSYMVTWQVVAADGHKTKGSYRFETKK